MRRVNFKGALEKIETVLPKMIAAVLAVITIVGLGVAILTAYFGVPMGDDYLAIKTYSNKHTWVAESWHSLTNTGRYMQSITSSLAYGLFRDRVGVILPLIVIGWLFAVIFLYTRYAGKRIGLKITNAAYLAISAPILFLCVSAGRPIDPNHLWLAYQQFFFSSAIVTYTIGFLLYLSALYIILTSDKVKKWSNKVRYTILFLGSFIFGLYNETLPATIFSISVLILAVTMFKRVRKYITNTSHLRWQLTVVSGASVLSLVAMYLSPANAARRASTGAMAAGGANIFEGVVRNLNTALTTMILRPSDIILAIAIGVFIAYACIPHGERVKLRNATIAIGGIALLLSGILALVVAITLTAVGYGPMANVYPRVLLIPQIIIYAGLTASALACIIAISRIKNDAIKMLVLCIALISTVAITPHHISRAAAHISGVQDYNAIWQKQDDTLRKKALSSPSETIYLDDEGAGIGDGYSVKCTGPYSTYTIWLTDGMEAYYGLREVCAQSDLKEPVHE